MLNFSEPRIVMGDFNTWPGTTDYNVIAKTYQDAWSAALAAGTATSYNRTGATHGASRFDYLFLSKGSTLSLTSVDVPDSRVHGVDPSNHDPCSECSPSGKDGSPDPTPHSLHLVACPDDTPLLVTPMSYLPVRQGLGLSNRRLACNVGGSQAALDNRR